MSTKIRRKRYDKKHLDFLRRGYLSMTVARLTAAFNARFKTMKFESHIRAALANHDIKCGRHQRDRFRPAARIYTDAQVAFLRAGYYGRTVAELTALFNCRFKSKKTEQQIKTFVKNRHITNGRTGHFPKGHAPFNKGTKGLMKRNSGTFKKGNRPGNARPLGSERVCVKDGFVLVKITERNPHTGAATRFKHKHVVVWERQRGPVPKGMVVAFRDGNKHNLSIRNLMLISRAELLRLNQKGYSEYPDEIKPSVLALTKLEVRAADLSRGMSTRRRL